MVWEEQVNRELYKHGVGLYVISLHEVLISDIEEQFAASNVKEL